MRWLLRIGGAQTDKEIGLERLRLTAEKGHYLQPYARLLLAVAALRDHRNDRARKLLGSSQASFRRIICTRGTGAPRIAGTPFHRAHRT